MSAGQIWPDGVTRRHLTVLPGGREELPLPGGHVLLPPSARDLREITARTAAEVVDAARAWAAEQGPAQDLTMARADLEGTMTAEQRARRRLLDSVHTLEYREAMTGAPGVRRD